MVTQPACYLDYNAGAPVKPAVAAAMADWLGRAGNPSSVHRFGRLARRAVEDARDRVAALVGAAPEGVVFTASGTEANNLALKGSGRPRLIVSAIEHDSVLGAGAGVLDRTPRQAPETVNRRRVAGAPEPIGHGGGDRRLDRRAGVIVEVTPRLRHHATPTSKLTARILAQLAGGFFSSASCPVSKQSGAALAIISSWRSSSSMRAASRLFCSSNPSMARLTGSGRSGDGVP